MQVSVLYNLATTELSDAERDVRLSRAARSNAHEQNIISDLVAAALHPVLEQEEEKQALVPFPAAWISSATGMRCVLLLGSRC